MSNPTDFNPTEFASAGNYPAGSDDWSGQPRRVEADGTERSEGFTPNLPVIPEVLNGLFGQIDRRLKCLTQAAMYSISAGFPGVVPGAKVPLTAFFEGPGITNDGTDITLTDGGLYLCGMAGVAEIGDAVETKCRFDLDSIGPLTSPRVFRCTGIRYTGTGSTDSCAVSATGLQLLDAGCTLSLKLTATADVQLETPSLLWLLRLSGPFAT